MALSERRMLERFMARDASYDRKFIAGVVTTGVYCVPSCTATKPKAENVRFFASPAEAQASGLRACKRCHPDHAYAGNDPEERHLSSLIEAVRAHPGQFANVEAMAQAGSMSLTKLHEGVRDHFHTTPLALLTDARIEQAKQDLLKTDHPISRVGEDAGFQSQTAFYENFGTATGMSPGSFRSLNSETEFTLEFLKPYNLAALQRYLARDDSDPMLEHEGSTFAFALGSRVPSVVRFEVAADGLRVRVDRPGEAAMAHAVLSRLIGLNQDPRPLEAVFAAEPKFLPLRGEEGLRVFQTPEIFDAIAWSIVGQQLTVRFAMTLRKRLLELLQIPQVGGLFVPLQPHHIADLNPTRLLPLQFSLRKAEYLVGISQRFLTEKIEPETLRSWSATQTEKWLLETRGFGPWSTNYVMMRGCGFGNCVPFGDTGLAAGLVRLYGLERKPTTDEIITLMRPFEPYRSLATFHLWFSSTFWAQEVTGAAHE